MKIFYTIFLLVLCSCQSELKTASKSYQENKDYKSLRYLSSQIKKGDSREEVLLLLGSPSYSPTQNQDYYHSNDNMKIHPDTKLETHSGLIIDYNKDLKLEEKSFELLAE